MTLPAAPKRVPLALAFFVALALSIAARGNEATAAAADFQTVQAESVGTLPKGASRVKDAKAGARAALKMTQKTAVSATLTGAMQRVTLRVRGRQCGGSPRIRIRVDGKMLGNRTLKRTRWMQYRFPFATPLAPGTHSVSLRFVNPASRAHCQRAILVDWVSTAREVPVSASDPAVSTPVTPSSDKTDPYTPERLLPGSDLNPNLKPTDPKPAPAATQSGVAKLWVDPNSKAQQAEDRLRAAGRTAEANLVRKIAQQPSVVTLGHYSNEIARLDAAFANAKGKSRVVISIYGHPYRDGLGSQLVTNDEYKAWINEIAAHIGNRPALTIVEPTAVATSVPEPTQSQRYGLLSYANKALGALPDNKVYLDAGNSAWKSPAQIIPRLQAAGIGYADGFALNDSNFRSTDAEISYGRQVSAGVGGKPFTIDTARNGNGPPVGVTGTAVWCNPPGMALGAKPTMSTGIPGVDAFLWIHPAGVSDAACFGYPKAGDWVDALAFEMARNAKW